MQVWFKNCQGYNWKFYLKKYIVKKLNYNFWSFICTKKHFKRKSKVEYNYYFKNIFFYYYNKDLITKFQIYNFGGNIYYYHYNYYILLSIKQFFQRNSIEM